MDHSVLFHTRQRELFDLRGDSRGKHHTLPVGRHAFSDRLDLISEPKLKQSIRLIVDDHLHLGQGEARLVNTVHQTARRGDNDVWIEQQSFELVFHVVAADYQAVRQVRVLGQLLEVHCRLQRQLSRRGEDHSSRTNRLAMLLEALDNGDDERGCFTTTRSRHRNHIEALEQNWNGSSLNRRWQ